MVFFILNFTLAQSAKARGLKIRTRLLPVALADSPVACCLGRDRLTSKGRTLATFALTLYSE